MSEKQILTNDDNYSSNNLIAETILAFLKYNLSEDDGLQVEVGTFDNCREYGNTYRAIGAKQDYTFCVYEHRNSDQIYINGCLTEEIKPYGPYSGDDKWFYHAIFSYNQHYEVAQKLYEFLIDCKNGLFVDKSKVD